MKCLSLCPFEEFQVNSTTKEEWQSDECFYYCIEKYPSSNTNTYFLATFALEYKACKDSKCRSPRTYMSTLGSKEEQDSKDCAGCLIDSSLGLCALGGRRNSTFSKECFNRVLAYHSDIIDTSKENIQVEQDKIKAKITNLNCTNKTNIIASILVEKGDIKNISFSIQIGYMGFNKVELLLPEINKNINYSLDLISIVGESESFDWSSKNPLLERLMREENITKRISLIVNQKFREDIKSCE